MPCPCDVVSVSGRAANVLCDDISGDDDDDAKKKKRVSKKWKSGIVESSATELPFHRYTLYMVFALAFCRWAKTSGWLYILTYQLPANIVRNLPRINSRYFILPGCLRLMGGGCYYSPREQRQLKNRSSLSYYDVLRSLSTYCSCSIHF